MRKHRTKLTILAVAALLVTVACAGNLRVKAQRTALGVTESVAALDQAETNLFAAGTYSAEEHTRVGLGIAKVARASAAYTAAVMAWPDGDMNAQTRALAAASALNLALDDLVKSFPQTEKARAVLSQAVTAIRAALATMQADAGRPPVSGATAPSPDLILELAGMAYALVRRVEDIAHASNIAPEQLAAARDRANSIADRREADAAKG